MTILGLLVFIVVIGLVFWAIRQLGGAFGIPAPIVTIINVLMVVIVVFHLLQAFGLWSGGPVLRLR